MVGHFPEVHALHEAQLLYRSGFCSLHNPALIDLPADASLAELVRHPHIHTSYTGDEPGLVDRFLGQYGLQRHVVAQAAAPLAIPFVVKQSPLVAIMPELITRLFASHADLRIQPLAVDGLELPISMVIHRRDRSDPLTRFVAAEVAGTALALFGEG